jgi:rhamnogalacturonyl hydrolase YesR
MYDRYARGLAAAIARNQRLERASRSHDKKNYHRACADGLKMALTAWYAMNAAPSTPEYVLLEQVRVAVVLADQRAVGTSAVA